MKRLGLFSVMLLAGCVPTQKEYTIIRETSRPVTVQAEESVAVQQSVTTQNTQESQLAPTPTTPCQQAAANGGAPCLQPAPTYFAGTYNKPQGVYQTHQHIAYQSGGCGGQVMCGQNLAATLGGNVMNMPAQSMAVSATPIQMPIQVSLPQMPIPTQMVQTQMLYETPALSVTSQGMPFQMSAPVTTQGSDTTEATSVVILQHPINRDLVKCPLGDVNCVIAYEAQGYIQLQNTATSYGNTMSTVNYAVGGTWQNNNNIPRW